MEAREVRINNYGSQIQKAREYVSIKLNTLKITWLLDNGVKTIQRIVCQQMGQLDIHMQRNEVEPLPHTIHKS